MAKLTNRQKCFVAEYLIDLNATQAAIRAKYSPKTARFIAGKLLSNINIIDAIEKKMAKREERTEITQDRVLKELALIGFSDITDYADIKVTPSKLVSGAYEQSIIMRNTDDMPKDKIRAIASVKEGQNGIEIKLNDKVKALELIGKHLGMFEDKMRLTVEQPQIVDDLNADDKT